MVCKTKIKIEFNKNVIPSKVFRSFYEISSILEKIDNFLLATLDVNLKCTHSINIDSSFNDIAIDVRFTSNDKVVCEKINLVTGFVENLRSIILEMPPKTCHEFNVMSSKIAEEACLLDSELDIQMKYYDHKVINNMELAKIIQKIYSMDFSNVGKISIECGHTAKVNSNSQKVKAIDLLGGKNMDKSPVIGHFILNMFYFENIEKRMEFLLNGVGYPVYITDQKWKEKFNRGEIKLKKGDRFKARVLIERSPLSRKPVYYMVEILGINQ